MPPTLSLRAQKLSASETFRLARRAQELREAGKNVLAFGLGEPDFDTPARVREAAKAAIDRGETHYTANEGILPLRQAIAEHLQQDLELAYDARTDILVTAGAKQAIANALLALVEEGSEVLVPAPYWVTYPELIRFCGAEMHVVPTTEATGYHLTAEALERAVTPKARVLVLNSPNNPTGAVLGRRELALIAEVCCRHDLAVVSDEIYGPLTYGAEGHASIAAAAGMRERTIVCNGMSKAFAMTGWRLGYAAGPAAVIGAMGRIQSHMTSNASSISQHAALTALRECRGEIAAMRSAFDHRRRNVTEWLRAVPGFELSEPEGAFYAFVRLGALIGKTSPSGIAIRDSASFCEALLVDGLVSVVPGSAFGIEGCFRLSYAAALESLQEGCARIREFVRRLT